jgi:heterotetrameric sarcosine oxidase beta subunit
MKGKFFLPRQDLRSSYDICIVGGGVHGLSLAYNLARSGRRDVAVFERSYIGAGASGRNLSLIRSSWQQPAWARLVWFARQLWRTISVELDCNVMFTERGSYLCLGQHQSVEAVERAVRAQNDIGIPTRFVTVDELAANVPSLNTGGMSGAIHDPTAGVSRHDALVWGYSRAASRLGVHIHPYTAVTGIRRDTNGIRGLESSRGAVATRTVVNCAGSESAAVGAMAGVSLPTKKLALEMFVTESYAPFLTPVISVIDDQAYVMQTSRGEFVGGAEPVGHLGPPSLATSYAALRQSAVVLTRLFPRLSQVHILRAWGGLVDMTPDGAGLVGEHHECPGFYLDCGWGGEGYMVAVATGRLIAELMTTGSLDGRLAPFHYTRFDRGEGLADDLLVVDAAGEMRT